MKLFISWSGERAQQIAQKLREWVPLVLPAVTPFITTTDIDKGAQWQGEIRRELEQSNFGIVCLTPENLGSQWLSFEAGALSKKLRGRVATVLFGVERRVVPPPFDMFQSTLFIETEVRQLVSSIDKAVEDPGRRGDTQLDALFPTLWPMLEEPITLILQQPAPEAGHVSAPDTTAVAQEMMAMLRQMNAVLSNPEKLLAPVLDKLDRPTRHGLSISDLLSYGYGVVSDQPPLTIREAVARAAARTREPGASWRGVEQHTTPAEDEGGSGEKK
jgi:hypothetical protein